MTIHQFHPVLGLQESLPKPPHIPSGSTFNLATGEPNAPAT